MAVNINVPSQVRTFANLAAFPASGAVKTIYIAEDTNKTYRWTGSVYVEISASGDLTGYVPYTGATGNVDLGTHTLSAKNIIVNHASGSGVAVSITKGGAGEALTVTKTSGSGNAMSVTGGNVQFGTGFSWDNSTNALTLTTGKVFSGYNSGGTSSDALKLELTGGGAVLGIQNSNASGFSGVEYLNNAGSPRVFTGFNNSNGQEFRFNNFATNGYIDFLIGGTSGLRIANTRNILINTTTDAGFKLDVNGTARVATSILVGGGATTGTVQTGVFRGTFFNDYANSFTIFQVQSNGNASFYQGLAIGTSSNAVASAQVEIVSTTKGFLPPRMTTTQRNAIASPAAGLIVYDTTLNLPHFFNGTIWVSL
jgi:hypothetical protein